MTDTTRRNIMEHGLMHLRGVGEDQLIRVLADLYPASSSWEQRIKRAFEDGVIESGQLTSLMARFVE